MWVTALATVTVCQIGSKCSIYYHCQWLICLWLRCKMHVCSSILTYRYEISPLMFFQVRYNIYTIHYTLSPLKGYQELFPYEWSNRRMKESTHIHLDLSFRMDGTNLQFHLRIQRMPSDTCVLLLLSFFSLWWKPDSFIISLKLQWFLCFSFYLYIIKKVHA